MIIPQKVIKSCIAFNPSGTQKNFIKAAGNMCICANYDFI